VQKLADKTAARDDDYFIAIALDPTDAELIEIKRELRRICKAK
jgi:hypothetical protein